MRLKKLIGVLVLPALMLACACIPAVAQNSELTTTPTGTWSGTVRCGAESQPFSLRFDVNKDKSPVMFLDMPEIKFHNLGPIPLKHEGDEWKTQSMSLRIAPDKKSMAGNWNLDGNDLSFELKPGELPSQPAPQPITGRIAKPLWTFKTGGAIWSSPALGDDVVYFGSSDGIVYAVGAKTGKPEWQFKTRGPVMGPPTIHEAHLYVLSDDGYLYKLDRKSGKLVWKFDTHGGNVARDLPGLKSATYDSMTSAATIEDGMVFLGSADKRIYAVDSETGQEKWRFETQGVVRSTPAVANGRLFAGSYDHNVYALDAKTGALQWKYDTLREVVSSPVVHAGTVYIGSRCSDLFAFDAATGKIKWKYFYWSSWVESSAAIRDNVLYIGSSDLQRLLAIDADSGKRIWSFYTDGSSWSTPAVTDKLVFVGAAGLPGYFVDPHGGFFAVDRATGKMAWHFPMPPLGESANYGVATSPVAGRGFVFFGGLDGVFYAFHVNG